MKYKGLFATDFRGKIDGMVGSKSRFGNYFRRLVTPVNPNTPLQTMVRSIFSTLTKGWGQLTEAQRNGWTSLADNNPQTDIYGDGRAITGSNLYMGINIPLMRAGESAISTPPADLNVTGLSYLAYDDPINVLDIGVPIAFNPHPLQANEKLWVELAENVAPGKTFVGNLFKFNALSPAAQIEPYTVIFSESPILGRKYWLKVSVLNIDNGVRSPGMIVSGTVVP